MSRDVVEIFVALYEVMLQILLRFFAHTEENEEQMYVLKSAFINLMPFGVSPFLRGLPIDGHIILYKVIDEEITIVRVVSGKQNLKSLFSDS